MDIDKWSFPFLFASLSSLTASAYEAVCSSQQSKDSSHHNKAPDIKLPHKENSYLYKGIDSPYPSDFQAFFVQQTHRLKEEKGVDFQVSNILIFTHTPSTLIIRAHKLGNCVQFSEILYP